MIAAVTDLQGRITGAHRTWLDPSGRDNRGRSSYPALTVRRQSSGFSLFGEAALTAFLYGYGGFDRPRRPLAPIRVAGSVVCASVSITAEREGGTDLPGCLAV